MKFILKLTLILIFCYQLGHPQCDSSYTYINDLPSSVTILAGSDSCFFDNDLDALNDIIRELNDGVLDKTYIVPWEN